MKYHRASQPHVLFVCTGNTCRSVLAEYLGRELFGGTVMFESAGIQPQSATDAENAIGLLPVWWTPPYANSACLSNSIGLR